MALQEIHSWTLGGVIGAFIDLFLAYFMLCGSVFTFFTYKFFSFFGFHLPCLCKGILGYRNRNFCWHKLLFEWPVKKICSIEVMAAKMFPFDLVWVKKEHSSCNVNDEVVEKTYDNCSRLVELEDETHCSSCSGLSLVEKESRYDAKGKRDMNMKRKSGFRRRRRDSYDFGERSDAALNSCLSVGGSAIEDRFIESVTPASGKEVGICYDEDAETGHDLDEKTSHCYSYEFNGSMVDSPGQGKWSSSLEDFMSMSTAQDNVQFVGSEENHIKLLENALEEENVAYASLYLELEKERSAAATSADEAMAMISRLQEDKASMEMEMRQYQRMIEERVAYDEEEMNILQEILIRKEMEIFYLERELESYKQTDSKGSYQSNGKPAVQHDELSDISSSYIVAQNCINTEHGEEVEMNTEQKDRVCDDLHSSVGDAEPDVLDVHVIDDNIVLDSSCEVLNEKFKIDNEIEILEERLRMIKHKKENLTSFAEKGEA